MFEEKENELTQKKTDFERQSALNQQQILSTEKKVNDLNAQLEISKIYEDKIKKDQKEQQREFDEKTQSLQAEKEGIKAELKTKSKLCEELETKLQKQTADAESYKAV